MAGPVGVCIVAGWSDGRMGVQRRIAVEAKQMIKNRIDRLVNNGTASVIAGGLKGVEKESLRVFADGNLADTPHPLPLGSAMTNS